MFFFIINRFAFIIIVFNLIRCGYCWSKSNFTINSRLPRQCGFSRRYFPEATFELWGTWPWLGILFYDGVGNARCNVILIHQEAVLTSLHCIKHVPEVILKDHLYVTFSTRGQTNFQNISVTHINFSGKSYNTHLDLALMKLSRPVIIINAIQPICMWEEHYDYGKQIGGHVALVVGSDFDNVYNLQELRVYQAPVRILTVERCRNIDNKTYENLVKPGICYTYLRDPKECHALGSMMLVPRLGEDGSFIWYLRGVITRRMFFCDKIPMQSAFDIGLHRKWIESHFKPSVEDKCGRRKIPYVQLVHLGENTQRGDWPWHGALFYDNNYRCGATLISQTILLTAAHCLFTNSIIQIPINRLNVRLGKHDLTLREIGSQILQINNTIIHPQYNTTNLRNDIAIVKLCTPIQYSDFIQPACLWDEISTKKEDIYYKTATVVGWGLTENQTTSNTLKLASVPIADDLLCLQSHPSFYENFLNENSFCAGNPFDNASNVCNGDSGGGLMIPLTQDDLEVSWFLRGIVSLTVPKDGTRICDPTKFTIYTDVAQYLMWIKENML